MWKSVLPLFVWITIVADEILHFDMQGKSLASSSDIAKDAMPNNHDNLRSTGDELGDNLRLTMD